MCRGVFKGLGAILCSSGQDISDSQIRDGLIQRFECSCEISYRMFRCCLQWARSTLNGGYRRLGGGQIPSGSHRSASTLVCAGKTMLFYGLAGRWDAYAEPSSCEAYVPHRV